MYMYVHTCTADSDCDQDFDPDNEEQFIVWAIGGLGETAFIHFERADRKLMPHYCVVLVWLNHVQGRGGALGLANLQLCVCVHLPPLPRYFCKVILCMQ